MCTAIIKVQTQIHMPIFSIYVYLGTIKYESRTNPRLNVIIT